MAGDDESFRMQVVSQARAFKRSWVDMAEALNGVRQRGMFRKWGYETIQGYALEELNIKPSTTDKLTFSYTAMEKHVPQVLSWDGVAQQMPEMEAVDYFARAVDPRPKKQGDPVPEPPEEDVVDQLKAAIFEEQVSTPSLRRRFNPVLNPKDETDVRLEQLQKVRAGARRLEALVTSVEDLSEKRVEEVTQCLEALRHEIDLLVDEG